MLEATVPQITFRVTGKIVPDAYHGTEKTASESIRKDGFQYSRNSEMHLGDGVYFYEGCAESALVWARKHRGCSSPVVLRCEINLGRCLDLNDREHKQALRSLALSLERRHRDDAELRRRIPKITEPLLINLVAAKAKADTVRAAYTETDQSREQEYARLHKWSRFALNSRLIICVRNLESILRTESALN